MHVPDTCINAENDQRQAPALRAQITHLTALVEALKSEVIRLRRHRYGASAERLDPIIAPQLPLMEDQADHGAISPVAERDDPTGKADAPPRLMSVDAPHKPSIRAPRRLPPELPRVIRLHQPARCQCPDCGKALRRLGEDVSEQLDYVPGYFQVIRHIRPKLACSACEQIVQAPAPVRPIERGLPTAGLLAQVISAKYADHCPLYRQEGIYQRAGVELPRTLLASWTAQSSTLLDPLVRTLERYVLSASKLHADDTPVPVLEPGRGKTRKGRLWTYVRDDRPCASHDPPAVVYCYSPDRKSIHPQSHLKHFAGILQADGYAGFGALYEREKHPLLEAACWAHVRRKFYDVYVEQRSDKALEVIQRIGQLYAIERQIRGQVPAARSQARREYAAPLLQDLHHYLTAMQAHLSAKAPLSGAIQYALTRWAALTRYVENGQIEIDNNAAERSIRALVLGRRNYLFAGSDGGGETAANLYSLIGTCRLNGIDPHRYLQEVIGRIAEHPIKRIQELLPWCVAEQWIVVTPQQQAA
jgi:transposase